MVEKYGKSYELELGSKQLKFIESMLNKESETIDGIKIAFYHGGPGDYAEQRIYPDTVLVKEEYSDFDFVFTGHTHYQLQTKIGECVVVNPGSLGQPRDGKGFSYCVFDTAFKRVEFRTVKADIDYELNNVNELEGCSCNYCYLERKYKVNI